MAIQRVTVLLMKVIDFDNLWSFLARENEGTEREAPSPGLGISQFH